MVRKKHLLQWSNWKLYVLTCQAIFVLWPDSWMTDYKQKIWGNVYIYIYLPHVHNIFQMQDMLWEISRMTTLLLIWDMGQSVTVPSRDVARFSVIMLRVLQPLSTVVAANTTCFSIQKLWIYIVCDPQNKHLFFLQTIKSNGLCKEGPMYFL